MTRIFSLLTGLAIIVAAATATSTAHADISWAAGAPGGTSGSAINFDGTNQNVEGGSWLDTGVAAAGLADGDYTISFWAQYDALRTNNDGDWVVGTGGGGETGQTQGIHVGSRHTGTRGTPPAARQGHWGNDSSGTSTISTGTWNHFTYQYDSVAGNQIIYVNGMLESTTPNAAPNNNIGNLILGDRNNGINNNDQFRGSLDDVAFYNEVISGTDILGIFDGSTDHLAVGADVYYDFEDDTFSDTATFQGTGDIGGGDITGIIPNAVPEPSSLALLLGLGGLGFVRRKRS